MILPENAPPAGPSSRAGWGKVGLAVGGGVWLVLLLAALAHLHAYQATAGPTGTAPAHWQEPSGVSPGLPRLVLIAHPRCPCTRASLEEFATLIAENRGRVAAEVLFYRPDGEGLEWAQTALWQKAAALPNVQVTSQVESRMPLGGGTSGTVLLYDADGRLLFQGGLTATRGEAGPSEGGAALRAWLRHEAPAHTQTPTYGCPLSSAPTAPAPSLL